MLVLADFERTTGVGGGGVALYVVALLGGIFGATLTEGFPHDTGHVLLFITMSIYGLGLLGVVAAISNLPHALRVAIARRRGVRSGLVGVTGTIQETQGTHRGPVRDEETVCYAVRVLKNDVDDEPDPDEEKNWSLDGMVDDGVPFAVVTDAGKRVRVDPTAATPLIDGREEIFVPADEEPPDRISDFCRAEGIETARGTARRYQESTLSPGDEAFVLGRGVEEAALEISDGRPFVVADAGYPARIRGRVTTGFLLGIPTTIVGFAAMLVVTGAV